MRKALPLATRVLVGVLLLGGAIGLLQVLKATKAEPALSENAGLPPLVRTVQVQRVVTARPWTGYGTVRAMSSARVAVQVAGRVVERPDTIEAGLAVSEGDLLLRIDPTDFQRRVAALEGLMAALEAELDQLDIEAESLDDQLTLVLEEEDIARREYQRARGVFEDRGAGSQAEVDQKLSALRRAEREASALDQRSRSIPSRRAAVQANLASQEAELGVARENLERATVIAPIDGVLQDVFLDTGDYAQVGTEVARIVDLARLELPLSLPASAADDIAIGDEVEVSLESGSAARWKGRISRLAPEADAQTRSIRVFVEVTQELETDQSGMLAPATGQMLRPGMFVVGRVRPSQPLAHLLVPRRAVVQGGVLVAEMNSPARAERVEVETLFALEGSFDGAPEGETQWYAVQAEIQEGQRVLVSNLDDLRDGSPIRLGEAGDTP
ncbi:MAG: efflux RND transporter periplasmic adaptor subunit [Phycisphaera sp.]|nr:MAG: efflux RND transporter periplasmic adaptor subunit [Phycisphaera sp.]